MGVEKFVCTKQHKFSSYKRVEKRFSTITEFYRSFIKNLYKFVSDRFCKCPLEFCFFWTLCLTNFEKLFAALIAYDHDFWYTCEK